jgi:phosphoglycerol transferase MdoB-like AlkP superfamily enzyme
VKFIPKHIQLLFNYLFLLFIGLQLTRLLFYLFNYKNFLSLKITDVFVGAWFDIITISILGLPFIILQLIPFPFRNNHLYQKFLFIVFFVTYTILLSLNLIDVEYYSYTQKRSTADLFTMLSAGNDFMQQISSFFKDFWLLLIFLLALYVLLFWCVKKIKYEVSKINYLKESLWFLIILTFFVLIGRGGFRLKPISPLDASKYTSIENIAFVLNTPFTILKSFKKGGLEEKKFMSLQYEQKWFDPIQKGNPQHLFNDKPNVVIIILESFGNEWVGASGAKNSFTPFLDSLAKHSLYFKNGIANGKKSIEAVPSIVSSLPSFMDNPYISSSYSSNKVNSLATILKNHGYETAFFHGATNGSMRFDAFSAQAGFNHYFGRKEYNNDAHFDNSWGILDEYFNPWTAKKLANFTTPFFATLFTLSSHHPYYIPPHLKGKLKKGPQQICESIHYGDYSLSKFFEEAKKQTWYENTIFVICADHTSASENKIYNQRIELFKIPILFFNPKGKIPSKTEERFFQHIDIFPTLMDLLNLTISYYSFGNSYFKKNEPEAVTYLEGTYHYFRKNFMLTFSNDEARNLYNAKIQQTIVKDSMNYYKEEVRMYENRLKAIIQRYNRDLIFNQTSVK